MGEIPPVVPLLPTTDMTSSLGQMEEGLAGGPDLANWMSLLLPRQDMGTHIKKLGCNNLVTTLSQSYMHVTTLS